MNDSEWRSKVSGEFLDIWEQEAQESIDDADRPVTVDDPYNEDGYCEFCGNGRWKYHHTMCVWDEIREVAEA